MPLRTPRHQMGSLVASAAPLNMAKINRNLKTEEWQEEVWQHYDECGEFFYIVDWESKNAGKAELVIQHKGPADEDWTDVDAGLPVELLKELTDSCGGSEAMISLMTTHVQVPGETYLIGQSVTDPASGVIVGNTWRVAEIKEIDFSTAPIKVLDPETGQKEPIGDDSMVIRIYRRHPRDITKADSPARHVRSPMREIEGISKHIGATIDSRLAGNGLLALPKEMEVVQADGTVVAGDQFFKVLQTVMITAISDRDSAAAVVPVVIRTAAEFIDKIKHITFGTKFDEQTKVLRDDAIRRLALGEDTAPEQLLGLGDTNHWSAYQIDEAGVKTAIEPILQLIVNALTTYFLRPLMTAAKHLDSAEYRVWYSVKSLLSRPNRSQDAKDAFDRFGIGFKALREALGFDESDEPTQEEITLMSLLELVRRGRVDPAAGVALGGVPATVAPIADQKNPAIAGDPIAEPGGSAVAPKGPTAPAPAGQPTNTPGAPPAKGTAPPTGGRPPG